MSQIVVEYNASDTTYLVHRFESSFPEFGSQLIVRETQEAICIANGKLLKVFQPGTYTLDTSIVPGADAMLPGGKQSIPFETFFLNKTVDTNFNWGTKSPVNVQDQQFGVLVPIGGFGSFEAYIDEFEVFYRQCIGTKRSFYKSDLAKLLDPIIQREIKEIIAREALSNGIYNLSLSLSSLSEKCKDRITEKAEEFGIAIRDFYLQNISVVGNDSSLILVKEALAKAAATRIESKAIEDSRQGYQTKRSFDVLETAADSMGNPESVGASLASAGIGLGAGLQFGNAISNLSQQNLGANNEETNQANNTQKSIPEKLKELKELHDMGILTDEEFGNQKKRLLEML